MSKIRIKNADGENIVVIDMETGKVFHRDGPNLLEDINTAALAFWGAVSLAAEGYRQARGHEPRDVVFEGAKDGLFSPGDGGDGGPQPGGRGGDVIVNLPETIIMKKDGGVSVETDEMRGASIGLAPG